MIVENQRNIKVHFAGAEQIDFSLVASKAGVKYFLFTCFPFISKELGLKGYPITCKTLFPPAEIAKFSKHTIMDSGLYTLMFGAYKGKKVTKDFLMQYTETLINFINTNNIQATCVEVDCQNILGVEQAWEFRRYMRDRIKNRMINVFHLEDGQKGLDRLIEFSDYLAISALQVRAKDHKNYARNIQQLTYYIKNKKPEIDIHLLGCTVPSMLQKNSFCSSSDSTSWLAVNRFGNILGKNVRAIDPKIKKDCQHKILEVLDYCKKEPNENRLDYYSNYYISALLHKMHYEKYAGNQD